MRIQVGVYRTGNDHAFWREESAVCYTLKRVPTIVFEPRENYSIKSKHTHMNCFEHF